MGNGTKVALVALLILMVVMIARFVRDDSATSDGSTVSRTGSGAGGERSGAGQQKLAFSDSKSDGKTSGKQGKPTGNEPARGTAQKPAPVGVGSSNPINPGSSSPGGTGQVTQGTGAQAQGTGNQGAVGPATPNQTTFPSRTSSDAQNKTGGEPMLGEFHQVHPEKDPSLAPGGPKFPPKPITSSGNLTAGESPDAGSSLESGAQKSSKDQRFPLSGSGAPGGSTQIPPVSDGRDREQRAPGDPVWSGHPSTDGSLADGRRLERNPGSQGGPTIPDKEKIKPEGPKREGTSGLEKAAGEKSGDSSGYPKTYVIEKGDSYWRIADHFYKNGKLAAFLEQANPGVKLQPGKKLLIPEPPAGEGTVGKDPGRANPAIAPSATFTGSTVAGGGATSRHGRTSLDPPSGASASGYSSSTKGYKDYVVQKGDTLSLIAKKFYDDPSKFHLIEEANGDLKYQVLQAGAKIKVPVEK